MADPVYANPNSSINAKADALLAGAGKTKLSPYSSIPSDAAWLKNIYALPVDSSGNIAIEKEDLSAIFFTSASLKYQDSSFGGDTVINPWPKFTRFADIPDPGIRSNALPLNTQPAYKGSHGMGVFASSALHDPRQEVHIRAGFAQYNSFVSFFTGFYNGDLGALARQGRLSTNLLQQAFNAVGTAISIAILPLSVIPSAMMLIGTAAKYFMNANSSQFYSLKPDMATYWAAVSSVYNQLLTIEGTVYSTEPSSTRDLLKRGAGNEDIKAATFSMFSKYFPDGYVKSNGTVDIFSASTRAKRMQMRQEALYATAMSKAGSSGSNDYFKRIRDIVAKSKRTSYDDRPPSIESVLNRLINTKLLSEISGDDTKRATLEQDIRNSGASVQEKGSTYTPPDIPASVFENFVANLADGMEFISFTPNYTGGVDYSFSNSTSQSSVASSFNSKSQSAREFRINTMDGNLTDTLGAIADGMKSIAGSVASSLHLEGLVAMAGNAFIDIPDNWQESVAQCPSWSYTIPIVHPYAGHPIARSLYMYFPICCFLALALPLSTGKQSHTSPFLIEWYDRGRGQCRLGIVSGLSLRMGTSNLGYNLDHKPLGYELQVDLKDLTNLYSFPIRPSFSFATLEGLFDQENKFNDLMMTMGSAKLTDFIYKIPMLKYQINRVIADVKTWTTASHTTQWLATLPGIHAVGAIMRGTDRS